MEDFYIFFGMISSLSMGINIYLIKSVSSLCERLAKIEGRLSPVKHDL